MTCFAVWTKTPDAAISGHNVEVIAGDVAACQAACESRSYCKSFDYYKREMKCDLSDMTAADVGLRRDYVGNPYDHYQIQMPGMAVVTTWVISRAAAGAYTNEWNRSRDS